MKKKFMLAVSLLLVLCLTFTACGKTGAENDGAQTDAGTKDIPKIAVLGSPLGTSSFTDEGYAGMNNAIADFDIDCEWIEVEEKADFETQARYFADTGEYDLIILFTTTAADPVSMIADDYPDQKFSICDCKLEGYDNVRSVRARDPEQAFLSGVLSGLVTTGDYADIFPMSNGDYNVLSYAGGADIPTSRAGAAGYIAGAMYANPDCEVIYTIVGSWTDPATAKEISLTNISRGADICTGNCGSGIKGVLEACKEQGTYYIATSPADNDAEYSLCCSVKRSDLFVYNEIKGIIDGTWQAGDHAFGIADGICDISFEGTLYEGKMPQELLDIIAKVKQQVVDGKLTVPDDPNEVVEWAKTNRLES